MMRFWVSLILAAGLVACHTETLNVTVLKAIPDAAYAKGVSAPFCGVAGDALVVAGGANFPDKSLLEGGAKRVYADIWACEAGEWVHAGLLPDSTAYGATFAVDGALVLAGGNVCGVTTDKVYELTLQDGAAVLCALPPLPEPMEQCGWTRDGDRLYLVGGVGTTGVYACTVGEYIWTRLADLPEPLVQPVAFASGGHLYVWGGVNPETLEVSDKGLVIPAEEPESRPLYISESGISQPETVRQLREAGFRGFLMGETFMKETDPGAALATFIHAL